MINELGGVNGRLDDEYNPAKTFEQTRRLVEHEGVAFIFNSLGTWTNGAIRPYLNFNEVPQLFVASGGRQVRGKTRPVDRSAGQAAPGALRRQINQRVHRCEGQAARKLAVIL
jgi:hypothetical protein